MSADEPAPRAEHLTGDEFRRWGHEVVDWIARYLDEIERYPVLSQVAPGSIRGALPAEPPQEGESFGDILTDVDRIIIPGLTHWQSPNFFAYFPANSSGPSILGDLLSSGLGVQGMLWATSPACTELESHVLDWLVGMLGLPDHFRTSDSGGGVIQDSASSATLCALLAARQRSGGTLALPRLCVYTSEHAHSSVEKGARIAGFPPTNVRFVAADSDHAMSPRALEAAMAGDIELGLVPCAVVGTVGTTSSLAADPVPAIAEVAQRYGAWVHVDAAMAGVAAVCPEHRWVNAGVESVDSWSTNPHKWLLTNFDCDLFWVADRRWLIEALSVTPEYLRNPATEAGAVIDYRDWQVPLGRRFRALKLWFVIRHYGVEGLRRHIRTGVALTGWLTERIRTDARFELAAPPRLNLVCFRHVEGDDRSEQLLEAVNATGEAYITHTRLDGRYVIRVSVGSPSTEQRHVEHLWSLLDRHA